VYFFGGSLWHNKNHLLSNANIAKDLVKTQKNENGIVLIVRDVAGKLRFVGNVDNPDGAHVRRIQNLIIEFYQV